MYSSTYPLPIFALAVSFMSDANAQLAGCDAVGCANSFCSVGNTTLLELGISELSTSISPEPLTWTIGLQRDDVGASHQTLLDRHYFIGTPPSLQLANSSSVRSCVLFFEGIAESLSFPGNISQGSTVGTCSDALGSSCVTDLISQSQDELKTILTISGQNWTESIVCANLQARLQGKVPNTCKLAHSQGWGTINVQSLTGPGASPSIQQNDCHPTTRRDYNVSLVSSFRYTAPLELPSEAFVHGITPVMTVFYPYSPLINSSNNIYESHLNCMKVIGSRAGVVIGTAGTTGSAPEKVGGSLMAISLALFVMLNLL